MEWAPLPKRQRTKKGVDSCRFQAAPSAEVSAEIEKNIESRALGAQTRVLTTLSAKDGEAGEFYECYLLYRKHYISQTAVNVALYV